MKYLSILILAFAAVVNAQTATKITVSGFGAAWPTGTAACSSTVTTNCMSGYTLTITPPSGALIVQQIPAGATTYTYTSPTSLSYGVYSLSMVTTGTLGTGVAAISVATKSSSAYAPSIQVIPAPGGLTVSFQ